ncbi:hypothetical protein ACSLBF_03700 [Pseudoalteromonas sp. T1lg65]|uniref:hypothetical protein n=1 Tax=Pseudoalteromonas sp. T1lg65 TaxID=2077101 RepID=UPI003F7A901D
MQIELKKQNRSTGRKFVVLLLVILCAGLLYFSLRPAIPKLDGAELNTVVVQLGDLDIHVPVYGNYASKYERLISAPAAAQVSEIYLRAGASVDQKTVIAKLTLCSALMNYLS